MIEKKTCRKFGNSFGKAFFSIFKETKIIDSVISVVIRNLEVLDKFF
jgi:hypothetical protein